MGKLTRRGLLKTGAAASLLAATGLPALSAPRRGGDLRLGLSGANRSDNWDARTHADGFMMLLGHGAVFDCLTEVNAAGMVVGELAESWEASPDAMSWTFNLRKGVRFHNGKAFGAEDVLQSLTLHLDDRFPSPARPIVNQISEMRKTGDYQVQLVLKAGNADFPYLLSDYHLVMYPAGQIEQAIADGIGTGLYQIDHFEPGERATLHRVGAHYKDGRAGWFDTIEAIVHNDLGARMSALSEGLVDAVNHVDLNVVAKFRSHPKIEVFETTGNQHFGFPMRTTTDPFSNPDVRKALKFGIDRQQMVKDVLCGHGFVGNDHPVGPANQFYHSALAQTPYDPDRAQFHLKRAGLGRLDVCLSTSNAAFPGADAASRSFQASAQSAGIYIDVKHEDPDGYWENVWRNKPWCACQWSGRAIEDWMLSARHSASATWNDSFSADTRVRSLLRMGRSELDTNKRREIYYEMQARISANGGTIVPMYANYIGAHSAKLAHGPDIGNSWQMDGCRIAERWWFA